MYRNTLETVSSYVCIYVVTRTYRGSRDCNETKRNETGRNEMKRDGTK